MGRDVVAWVAALPLSAIRMGWEGGPEGVAKLRFLLLPLLVVVVLLGTSGSPRLQASVVSVVGVFGARRDMILLFPPIMLSAVASSL